MNLQNTIAFLKKVKLLKSDSTVISQTAELTGNVIGNVTGNLTGDIVQTAVAAEHGPASIGTGAVPATYRRTENGIIITEIKIDLTGLNSGGTANDAIGLSGLDACWIGRNVIANNGIIFKMELICLELPVGGDTDINVVEHATDDIQEDEAAGTDYGVDGGTMAAGIVVTNDSPSLTANEYLYLASGGTTDATYTAGQLIVRMFGHAAL